MKTIWDLFIGFILVVSCSVTPYHIAFYDYEESIGIWKALNYIFDIAFGIDLILQFFSAYYDEDFYIIDELKIIAMNYLQGWFIIDITAIFPFDLLHGKSDDASVSSVIRVARIGRMWRLIKLTRLIRFVKIVK